MLFLRDIYIYQGNYTFELVRFFRVIYWCLARENGSVVTDFKFRAFLWMGITIASFRQSGWVPVLIERLNILLSGFEISFLSICKTFTGMLKGPVHLFNSSDVMRHSTSVGSQSKNTCEFDSGFF